MENIDSLKIARKLLKSKREELSLSIEDICRELKLDKKIIKNIESGNFSNFKSYLFLKGYIKNYADFLGIDINLPESGYKKKYKNINKSRKKESKKKYLNKNKYLFILLIFVLLSISISVYKNKDQENIDVNLISESLEILETKKLQNDDKLNVKNEISVNSGTVNDSFMQNEKIEIENITNSKIDKIKKDPDILSSDYVLENKIEKILEIKYNEDSWTEIIDSNQDIVFLDLVKKGKILKFSISAPFEILLGNATAVNIKYNNEIVGISYINPDNNVGKLKIKH
ncbi:MAG: helix-turn-helix domain-containing protein [Gammaproteobacteria bacterium]|nr:helix-turn-helix domain-containing protein [Gammaproteobacteria bacterium]